MTIERKCNMQKEITKVFSFIIIVGVMILGIISLMLIVGEKKAKEIKGYKTTTAQLVGVKERRQASIDETTTYYQKYEYEVKGKKYQIDTIVLAEELEKKLTISMEGLEKEQQEGFKNRDISKKQQDSSNNRNISKKQQDGSKNRNISLKEKKISKDWKPLKEKQKQNQINLLISRKVKLLNGKGLMPYLIKEILEYIMEKQNTKTQLEDIYFCIKESTPIYIQNIYNLTPYFKTVNIITPNITKFQKMADKIEEAEGSMITVINNKKKSLKKAQWIVNFDFTKEELKSYTIFRRAIILAIKSDGEYDNICFEGALIQKAKIDTSTEIKEFFEKYHLLGNCSLEVLYESLINEKQGLIKVKQKMEQDQIKVIKLYGSNLNFRQLTK